MKRSMTLDGLAWVLVAMASLAACGGMEARTPGAVVLDPKEAPADYDDLVAAKAGSTQLDPARSPGQREGDMTAVLQKPGKLVERVAVLCRGGRLVVRRPELLTQAIASQAKGLTLELWVRVRTIDNQRIADTGGLQLAIEEGRFVGRVGGHTITGLNAVADEWYHLALVVDATRGALYVNGMRFGADVRVTSEIVASQGLAGLVSKLVVGGQSEEHGESFCGRIDNLQLVGKALQQKSQVFRTYEETLVGYSFDGSNSSDALVRDEGSLGVPAKLIGAAKLVDGQI